MTMKTIMRFLYNSLTFADYAKSRGDSQSGTGTDPEKWIFQGIHDLDFDPKYFLGTGQTSPEGWAVHDLRGKNC